MWSVKPPSSRVEELKRKGSETDGDGDSLLLNAELTAGAVSSILKDSDLKRSSILPIEEALALSLQGVTSVSSRILPYMILTCAGYLSCIGCGQVATHLKSLAKKVNQNEGHVKVARVYNSRVASLTSERAKLQDRVKSMTEEAVKLKSNLRHTLSVRTRAEGREDEARNSLRAAEVELQEVKDGLQAVQNDLLEARDGL